MALLTTNPPMSRSDDNADDAFPPRESSGTGLVLLILLLVGGAVLVLFAVVALGVGWFVFQPVDKPDNKPEVVPAQQEAGKVDAPTRPGEPAPAGGKGNVK